MGLSGYSLEPGDDEFVATCERCGRPVRAGEFLVTFFPIRELVCWDGEEGCATEHEVAVMEEEQIAAARRLMRALTGRLGEPA